MFQPGLKKLIYQQRISEVNELITVLMILIVYQAQKSQTNAHHKLHIFGVI